LRRTAYGGEESRGGRDVGENERPEAKMDNNEGFMQATPERRGFI
jgi:hypothetical protein